MNQDHIAYLFAMYLKQYCSERPTCENCVFSLGEHCLLAGFDADGDQRTFPVDWRIDDFED